MQKHLPHVSRALLLSLLLCLCLKAPQVIGQVDEGLASSEDAAFDQALPEPTQGELKETGVSSVDGETPTNQDDKAVATLEASGSMQDTDSSETEVSPESGATDETPPEATQPRQSGNAADEQKEGPVPENEEPGLTLLGTTIGPGEAHRLLWVAGETSYGSKLETPVYVIRGKKPGVTLCLTAAIHGDELNGVEIVRQLVSDLSPKKLSGTVIGVPIVNLLGFTRGTRYLPDRRDLNRYFPGNPRGSSASRIAYSFFEEIIRHCDLLIDLHTGSLTRTNMPQVRANLQIPEVLEFTTKFGSTAVLHSRKLSGNLRSAATNQGVPAVALELGEPGSLQKDHVEEGVSIIKNVLSGLNMNRRPWRIGESQPVFYSSRWVRVNSGGLLISKVEVGERISEGVVLGSMVNPITNESFDVISPYSGRVLGMALNQFMLPGYAAFNIGIVADKKEVAVDAQTFECTNTEMQPEQIPEEFGCSPDEDEEDEEVERIEIELGETEGEEGT